LQSFPAPIAVVERRIGENVVSFQVFVLIVAKTVVVMLSKMGFDPPNREIYLRQFPRRRVRLLTTNGDVAKSPAVIFDELIRLHEHPARRPTRFTPGTVRKGCGLLPRTSGQTS
jgi:hypothetical protein